jgi:hypothetical protein
VAAIPATTGSGRYRREGESAFRSNLTIFIGLVSAGLIYGQSTGAVLTDFFGFSDSGAGPDGACRGLS